MNIEYFVMLIIIIIVIIIIIMGDNPCILHTTHKNDELIDYYKLDPKAIYAFVYKIMGNERPNILLSFNEYTKNVIKNSHLACLLQLVIEYKKYKLDFEDSNVKHFIEKYNASFSHLKSNNYYDDILKPKLLVLINMYCSCSLGDYVYSNDTSVNVFKSVLDKRSDIFMKKYKLKSTTKLYDLNIAYYIEQEKKIIKEISPFIINTITMDMKTIDLRNYDLSFLKDKPYDIHDNMINYICDVVLTQKFNNCDDIHYALHQYILVKKNERTHKISSIIIENIPYKYNENCVNLDIFDFVLKCPYYLPKERLPLVKQYFFTNVFDYSDYQLFVYQTIKNIVDLAAKIPKNIIIGFPLQYCDVTFTKKKLDFVIHRHTYGYPKSKLKLLVTKLSEYDWINCDDIHLGIHNIIMDVKSKLQSYRVYIIDKVHLSKIYFNLNEKNKVKLIKSRVPPLFFCNNKIINDSLMYIYPGETRPNFYGINFDISICMLCDKFTINKQLEFTTDLKIMLNPHCFKYCDGFCSWLALNNPYSIRKTYNSDVYDITDKFYGLRHFDKKIMLLVYDNWKDNLDMDTFNIIFGFLKDLVLLKN